MKEISKKQLAANRQNAKQAGVKTEEGKMVVSGNALRHGILSEKIIIEGENAEKFEQLKKALVLELMPLGAMESLLVERIAICYWRLRRVLSFEKMTTDNEVGAITNLADALRAGRNRKKRKKKKEAKIVFTEQLEKIQRYETSIERSLFRNLHELQRMQSRRLGGSSNIPIAIDILGEEK